MNIWPRKTLAFWIRRAKGGKPLRVVVSAEKENICRPLSFLELEGYELYRCFHVRCAEESEIIKKTSVSVGGYNDDPEHIKRENVARANARLERDIKRLKKAGIKVEVKNKFKYENLWGRTNPVSPADRLTERRQDIKTRRNWR